MSGEPTGKHAPDLPAAGSSAAEPQRQRAPAGAAVASAVVTLSSGRRYELDVAPFADRIVVRNKLGDVVLRIEVTDAGPVLSFATGDGEHGAGSRSGVGRFDFYAGEGAGQPMGSSLARGPGDHATSVRMREAIAPPPSLEEGGGEEDEDEERMPVPRATPLPFITRGAELGAAHPSAAEHPFAGAVSRSPGRRLTGQAGGSAFIADALHSEPPPEPPPGGDMAEPPHPAAPGELAPPRRRLPLLRLERYAMLCAESSTGTPESFDHVLLRHGVVDRALWRALDHSWQERLGRDPILTLRWMELTARYREQLKRR